MPSHEKEMFNIYVFFALMPRQIALFVLSLSSATLNANVYRTRRKVEKQVPRFRLAAMRVIKRSEEKK